MDDLIDDDTGGGPPGNTPEFTVSEISGAVKRTIEGNFARVRVRGEIGRLSRRARGMSISTSRMTAASWPRSSGKGSRRAWPTRRRRGWKWSRPGG
jgi:hypothetical protein